MDALTRSGSLSPSPRHMRKRRFRRDVPNSTLASAPAAEPVPAPREGRSASPRSKRLVALAIVMLVTISVPALALSLFFGR